MYNISLITGDGIGPELSESAISVLETIHDKLDVKTKITSLDAGDSALERFGKALPDETFQSIKSSDACLKAPVGESAADVIVVLRRKLDLFANIRPAKSYPNTPSLRDDIDLVIVRENTEDLYTGQEFMIDDAAVVMSFQFCSVMIVTSFALSPPCTSSHRGDSGTRPGTKRSRRSRMLEETLIEIFKILQQMMIGVSISGGNLLKIQVPSDYD